MRAAKSRTWTTAAAVAVFAVVATAWPAVASPWPPADVAGVEPASPLLAAVDVELEPAPPAPPAPAIATAPDVELALEAPRSWTHLEELERLSESVLWGLAASASGAANPCETGRLRLKTRVRGYQLFGGGNGAVVRPLRPVIPMGFGASCTAESSGGVFLSTDPLGYVDGPNLYQYGLNNPVNFSDPMGLESAEIMQRHRMAYETDTNPYYMQTAAEGAVVVAEEMAPYLANPYVQGSLQMVGGCLEAGLGGAAVLSGVGTVPGAIALAYGADMCGTGFITLWAGETQETLFFQGVRGGLEVAGVDPRYSGLIASGVDLGAGFGVSAGVARSFRAFDTPTSAASSREAMIAANRARSAELRERVGDLHAAWRRYQARPDNSGYSIARWKRSFDVLQRNRAQGRLGEVSAGTAGEVFNTPFGRRFVDVAPATEIKTGYASRTRFIRRQILKDAWLKRVDPDFLPIWEFHGRASAPLLEHLQTFGIPYRFR